MIDLYQLRTFLAAAREQSFTRAARALHVSPPAVSQSVALLERSLSRRLFRREGRRVALTAEGAALMARAQRVFDEVDAAEREARGEAAAPSDLRLLVREMVANHLLPGVPAELQGRRPGTRVSLHVLEPRDMLDALLKDKADAAFYYAPLAAEGIVSSLLGRMTSHV